MGRPKYPYAYLLKEASHIYDSINPISC